MKRSLTGCCWLLLLVWSASWARVVPDRYIVELGDAPVAVRMGARGRRVNAAEAAAHRRAVLAGQQNVRQEVERQGGEVLGTVTTVANALLVRMPGAEAAKLAAIPGVKSVHPVRTFKLLLDHAVVVTKVTDAWNQIGLDKAGLGIKIAIIDTGIDNSHPGFQDPSLAIPSGFPKVNKSSDTAFTNNKVIVARSYSTLWVTTTDPDPSARDDVGHGTAVAMAAAGVLNSGPLATIRGVAPQAYLGSYKVFGSPGVNDEASDAAIIQAIDDAVKDGMDVINLSLGDSVAVSLNQDIDNQVIQNAVSMGAIVVVAGGNGGPNLNTIGPPASSPFAISVGASFNNREFADAATVGGTSYTAIPGTGPAPSQPVSAPLKDVSSLDGTGMACSPFSAGSLKGEIAFILRGTCFFSDKLNNVQAGGAVGALVYTDAARPEAIIMDVASATLPALMVSYQDGISIKQRLASSAGLSATLDFTIAPRDLDPDALADFSAKGPNVDGGIKPDLVAVGTNVYTAAEKTNSKGDVYDPSGYLVLDGTSFSSPIVAGAAALLKGVRPGLTVADYRSLLVNTTAPAYLLPGVTARVQEAGAGLLDMSAAIRADSVESPASLSFGVGAADVNVQRTFTVSNVGTAAETYTLFVAGRDAPVGFVPPGSRTEDLIETSGKQPVVSLSEYKLTLNPGASAAITVTLAAFGLSPGAHEGSIHVMGANSGVDEHVPYWYAVPSNTPVNITILSTPSSPKAGSFNSNGVLFRVTDASGIDVPNIQPTATVVSGGGKVGGINNLSAGTPGVFGLTVTLGPVAGDNVFKIQVGSLSTQVTITSQ